MISAMEKEKLVYVLNRDAAANLTISSPSKAHQPHAILLLTSMSVLKTLVHPTGGRLHGSDQDPTDEAFNNAEKVCWDILQNLLGSHWLLYYRC